VRPSHRLAVTALVAAALVSGCSGEDGDPSASSTSETASVTDSPSESPTDDPAESPTESPTEGPTESTAPTGSPSGVATGELVEGFPVDVIPVVPDATITVSSVVPLEGARMVSLSGTTTVPADQVLGFYRTSLVGQGFVETAAGQPAGFPTATFSRANGADLIVVAVSTVAGVQTFTVGGTMVG